MEKVFDDVEVCGMTLKAKILAIFNLKKVLFSYVRLVQANPT